MKNLFLFLAIFLAIPASSLAFSDVPTTHRFSEEIKFVQEKGIVGGYTDGTFKPESTINRAEFTKIIISALYTKEEIENCDTTKFSFPDVPKTEWYAKFVCLAKKNGIINGYADGKFLPNGTITLPEAMKIVLSGYKVDMKMEGLQEKDWYDKYLFKAGMIFNDGKLDIITAMQVGGTTFEAIGVTKYKISRGEMAYFIQKIENTSQNYIGLTIEEAEKLAEKNGVSFRVVKKDGEFLPATMDYRIGRINAEVESGIVTSYRVEGQE